MHYIRKRYMYIVGNLHTSHSRDAQARELTAVYHLSDGDEQGWWKCRKWLSMGAGLHHPYVNYILLSCFICSTCSKQVMSMTSTHIRKVMAMPHQGTQVWKWAKHDKLFHSVPCDTDDTRMVSGESWDSVILWALPRKFPGQRVSEMLSVRNSASHLTDIILLLQWFISPQR